MRAGQWGEGEKKGQEGWGVCVLWGRWVTDCALMMAQCEINQTQPCPFSLWDTDRGLIWAGQLGRGGKRNLNQSASNPFSKRSGSLSEVTVSSTRSGSTSDK